ncbi:hypothetical protein PCANC_04515 [Puccinia coronata f. sp. avenae]|uniref:DUF4219 domain-containing protein n=1 Tax=Puccinia coronata f. sp. avenae TaxID=200324 RepID=A0A2N5VW42_9BASI|nr:hypothetical protein PCANC_04515 [Puccinia coronata f. sp. avenae]
MDSESCVESSRYLLTSDNYSTWTVSIEAKLEDIGARKVVTGTTLPETNHFNGRALWKLLKEKYAGSNLVARLSALDHFLDLEYHDIASFCSAIRMGEMNCVTRLKG